MRKADFVFVYEIKPRELESIALLGCELERRGYSVAYVNTWHSYYWLFKGKISAKVAVVYAAYNSAVLNYALSHVRSFEKVVNLQWEQLLSIGEKDDKSTYYYIQGKAEEIIHFSWGQVNYDRLVRDCHLKPERVKIIGHIGMDFFRPELYGYFMSKEEICEKYSLPLDKKICLFISSFSYVNLPEEYAQDAGDQFIKICTESQKIVLQWIERILTEREDVFFIYRPHPAEASNIKLNEMEKRIDRFRVINQHSVKQWILIVDQIYNWYSTSFMEIFSAGKSCFLLRPIKVPLENEIEIFLTASFIENYDEFSATIDMKSQFPVSSDIMYQNYFVDSNEATYIKAANELERIYSDQENILPENLYEKNHPSIYQLFRAFPLINIFVPLVWRVKALFGNKVAKENIVFKKYAKQLNKQNYASDKEILELMEKITACLSNNTTVEDR